MMNVYVFRRAMTDDIQHRLKQYCEEAGFFKEREISFPHKQSNLMKLRREAWDAPAI
jgi:hypothetical protein